MIPANLLTTLITSIFVPALPQGTSIGGSDPWSSSVILQMSMEGTALNEADSTMLANHGYTFDITVFRSGAQSAKSDSNSYFSQSLAGAMRRFNLPCRPRIEEEPAPIFLGEAVGRSPSNRLDLRGA